MERHGDSGLLRSVAVDVEWRGRGIAERLIEDRIAWARRTGIRDLYLLTTTAASYFPRFGFTPVDRADVADGIKASSEFADVCPSSATVMKLSPGGSQQQ